MNPIVYIDRISKKKETEQVFGGQFLKFLYGNNFSSRIFGRPLLKLLSRNAAFSILAGWWQKQAWTKQRIIPFIQKFHVDSSEFADPLTSYQSFNDFFIRHLKTKSRPIAQGENIAIMPADGRYLFFQNISQAQGFIVKGEKFELASLLNDSKLAAEYEQGTMVIARLCPTDYHRFHFPADCIPNSAELINGWLYSVNPIALKKNISIFTENKRSITKLKTKFGNILYIEIGATTVGTIVQTYTPNTFCSKGAEKGYFSFGGSSIIILFPPNSIEFDQDLIDATNQGFEIRCLFGQSLGKLTKKNEKKENSL